MLPLLSRFILNFSSAFFKRWVYWLALNFKVASLHSNKFNSLKILLYKLFFVFFYYYYLVLNGVAEGFVSSKTLFQVEQFILVSLSSKRRKNVTAGRQSSQEYLWMWFTLQKLSLNWLIHPWKKSKHEAFLFFFGIVRYFSFYLESSCLLKPTHWVLFESEIPLFHARPIQICKKQSK